MNDVMLHSRCLSFILCIIAIASRSETALAQDIREVIVLHRNVGTVIDSVENARYQIFTQVKDLHHAIIQPLDDSTCLVTISAGIKSGMGRDTVFRRRKSDLFLLAEKIEHFDDIDRGRYTLGTQPVTDLQIQNREEAEMGMTDSASDGGIFAFETTDGINATGILLAVRDTALVFLLKPSTFMGASSDTVKVIPVRSIRNVHRYVPAAPAGNFMVIGAIAGAASGLLIAVGLESSRDFGGTGEGYYFVPIFTVFGSLVGLLVHAIASSLSDWTALDMDPDHPYQDLKPYARYPDQEPEFLRKIQ